MAMLVLSLVVDELRFFYEANHEIVNRAKARAIADNRVHRQLPVGPKALPAGQKFTCSINFE